MGFQTLVSLDCDTAIQLGGKDRKTGKAHPTSIEGYYVGSKEIASPKSKTGFSKLHVFQTSKGAVGVWGKTDLDRKLASATIGVMTRVTFTGLKETKNNPMYVYKVEVDADNSIDVASLEGASEESDVSESYGSEDEESSELDPGDESPLPDEVPPQRATPPKAAAAATPSKAQQERARALLNGRR